MPPKQAQGHTAFLGEGQMVHTDLLSVVSLLVYPVSRHRASLATVLLAGTCRDKGNA
jgi:hypothetical protein